MIAGILWIAAAFAILGILGAILTGGLLWLSDHLQRHP